MPIKLDHIFILTDPDAPPAAQLAELGLIEGSGNQHPSQGTANRRFFFTNTMLELLYVHDAAEAMNGPGHPLRFVERTANAEASPFGLIVKTEPETDAIPFPGWRYEPDYFPANNYFHVGENSAVLEEPLCLYVPFVLPASVNQPQPAAPFTTVSELHISVPVTQPSSVLKAMTEVEGVSIRIGEPHLLEMVFSDGQQGQRKDLRPSLPLLIHW